MTSHFKFVVVIVVAALVVALVTFGYLRSRKQPRFPYMTQALSDAEYAAMAARPGWRAQLLEVAPGIRLRGLVREPATPDAPWVLFFSGNSANMLGESQRVLDELCANRGWGGVVWAYRGYDSSGGTPAPEALAQDGFKGYLQLLAERKIGPQAVHVVGFSMGTSVAVAVAALASQNPPASLTLLAPMTELYMGNRTQMLLHHYETTKWLSKVLSPTLVVHGAQDATLDVEGGRAVARALGSRATLLELAGLGHYELPMSPQAQDAVRNFIAGHSRANKTD